MTQTVRVELAGGLGNQIFQITAAIALFPGSRILLSDSIFNSKSELKSFHLPDNVLFLEDKEESIRIRRLARYLLRTQAKRKLQFLPLVGLVRVFVKFLIKSLGRNYYEILSPNDLGFDPKINRTFKNANYRLIGYFQSGELLSGSRLNEFSEIFKYTNSSEPLSRAIELAKTENPIVLHLRLGDYLDEKNFGIPAASYFTQAYLSLKAQFPHSKVWLFSNNIQMAKEYLAPEILSDSRIFEGAGMNSEVIFEIMRHGSAYILSNSTFGWWAARLSNTRNAVVISPSPWFRRLQNPNGIYVPSWRTMSASG